MNIGHEQSFSKARAVGSQRGRSQFRRAMRIFTIAACVISATAPLRAQSSQPPAFDESNTSIAHEDPALSADRIIRIFREHPELMAMARSEVEARDPSQA